MTSWNWGKFGDLGVHIKGFLPWLVHLAQFVFPLIWITLRETREGWILMTCSNWMKGDFFSTYGRGHSLVGSFGTICNSSFFAVFFGSHPERPERGGPCWLLKLRQMGTLEVHVKGVLPRLVQLAQFVIVIPLSLLSDLDLTQRLERDGLCWLLKLRQMETLGVHMKEVLPWLVPWARRARTIDFCPSLATSQPSTIYYFAHRTLFTVLVLIAQQPGSPVSLSLVRLVGTGRVAFLVHLNLSKPGRQSCRVACLLICVSVHSSLNLLFTYSIVQAWLWAWSPRCWSTGCSSGRIFSSPTRSQPAAAVQPPPSPYSPSRPAAAAQPPPSPNSPASQQPRSIRPRLLVVPAS
jgi:hypothetical protein